MATEIIRNNTAFACIRSVEILNVPGMKYYDAEKVKIMQ